MNHISYIHKWSAKKGVRNLILALFYAVAYDYIYCNFVNELFGYSLEGTYVRLSGFNYFLYLIIASTPLVLYKGIRTIASAYSLFVFLLAYIPIINSLFVYNYPINVVFTYTIVFFVSMCAFFLTDKVYLLRRIQANNKNRIPFVVLECLTLFFLVIVIVSNRSQLHFVNFFSESKDVLYDLRADTSIRFVYLSFWLKSAFLPVLLVEYLKEKNYIKYCLVFLAFFVAFMVDKQKGTALSPFVITGLYFVVSYLKQFFSLYFHVFLIFFLAVPTFFYVLYYSGHNMEIENTPLLSGIAILLIMRTQCICGMELERYMDFFVVQAHPYTHYGHINIVNSLIKVYPYKESVGRVVAGDGSNSNATFWLMDGVAADGLMGVLIISVVFILFKATMNSLDIRVNKYLLLCITLIGVVSMLNVSLFTALNSCGFIVLYLIVLVFDLKTLNSQNTFQKHTV